MPKKLILLLVIFLVTVSILIFVSFFNTTNLPPSNLSNNARVQNPLSEASIYLKPDILTTIARESALVDIELQTTTPINLLQIELSYNPSHLYSVGIIPGNYFLDPEVVLYNINPRSGRISYAIKSDQINETASTAATITFIPANYGLQKQTEINFLPKTLLRNNSGVVKLNSLNGVKIFIEPSLFTPVATSPAQTFPPQP